MKPFKTDFKKCRPLLGTFVEISLWGADRKTLEDACKHAFRTLERISSSLSYHDRKSELTALNRKPVGRWLQVSAPMREVLGLALELQKDSGGHFNVAIADPLTAWKILPGVKKNFSWSDLQSPGFEIRGVRARRLRPVRIDLGGIAKGYAVDSGVRAILKRNPLISGIVNAGGDLRVFGSREHTVWVRSGQKAQSRVRPVVMNEGSLATSTAYLPASPYVNPILRTRCLTRKTVSVFSDRCVVADALTKVGLLLPRARATKIAENYGARMVFAQ